LLNEKHRKEARVDIQKLMGAVAAVVVTFGVGAATVPSASAADNIKTYGEEETLNGPNSQPYIGYTVYTLRPSSAPVPHNGQLYSAKVKINGYGGMADPMIGRFGARAESGAYYPAIWGASNGNKLYFDVVGDIPNSVVWNDGVRDILVWIEGQDPREPHTVSDEPGDPVPPPYDPYATAEGALVPSTSMPTETDPALVATPNDLAQPPFELTEAEVAMPGFNASGGGGGRR
jgi:hypothetical protein